jgi:NaMN:DMB phosphoribosyltransferase
VSEKTKKLKEMATGGASSAGAVATSVGGPAHKKTSGVPKKVGNAYKQKAVTVGKGVYDK